MTNSAASTTPRFDAPTRRPARRPRVLLALGATIAAEAVDAARAALEAAGLPVTIARDTHGALESGLRDPPDALLIDPGLPAADVVATLRFAGFRGPVLAWDEAVTAIPHEADGGARGSAAVASGIDVAPGFDANARVAAPLDVGALLAGPLAGLSEREDEEGFDAIPEFARLRAAFHDGLPATLARLRSLSQERAWDELARELHRLKGSAGTFGRADLTRDALRAGALLAAGQHDAASALCAGLSAIEDDLGRGVER